MLMGSANEGRVAPSLSQSQRVLRPRAANHDGVFESSGFLRGELKKTKTTTKNFRIQCHELNILGCAANNIDRTI